jgi:hypothetical protein
MPRRSWLAEADLIGHLKHSRPKRSLTTDSEWRRRVDSSTHPLDINRGRAIKVFAACFAVTRAPLENPDWISPTNNDEDNRHRDLNVRHLEYRAFLSMQSDASISSSGTRSREWFANPPM